MKKKLLAGRGTVCYFPVATGNGSTGPPKFIPEMIPRVFSVPAALVLSVNFFASPASKGATLWNEEVDGDLPGDFSSPQALVVAPGENTFSGSIGDNGDTGATDGGDADYLSLLVPDGLEIVSISVQTYSFFDGNPGGGSFLGYRPGSDFAGQGFDDIDAWTLFFEEGLDILPDLGLDSLAAGPHAFWLQETNPAVVDYTLSIEVVPEPSAGALLIVAALLTVAGRRRR